MSADPAMLWRFEEVSKGVNVVSFSDAHSFWPWRLGREATIFEFSDGLLSYDNIIKAIRTGSGLKGTIETPPEMENIIGMGTGFVISHAVLKKQKN